jgi:hypothetical protein
MTSSHFSWSFQTPTIASLLLPGLATTASNFASSSHNHSLLYILLESACITAANDNYGARN